ncbi:MAG: DUF1553 domain-containing protein, partial [Planctomycetota bacterium]
DSSKTDSSKTDSSKTDSSKTDSSKTDSSKTDSSKTGSSKTAPSVNVALAGHGATVSSSGHSRGGAAKHPDYVIDGKRKWDNYWKAERLGRAWLKVDFPRPVLIDRIVWATRRRSAVPADYRIEIRRGEQWIEVAHSRDRLPHFFDKRKAEEVKLERVVAEQVRHLTTLLHELGKLQKEYDRLQEGPQAFLGSFEEPPVTQILHRGDPTQPKGEVDPGVPTVLGGSNWRGSSKPAVGDTERRVAFARWLGKPSNPLTARVMVNRIWQYHFGAGLVDTPSDFGTNGSPPTHPKLLDWLAVDFMRSGWSVKHLHRRILCSSTYRQSSAPRRKALQVDSGSRWLWRFPPRRLAAEVVRDSILFTSGALDLRMYGPGYTFFKRHKGHEKNTFADAIPVEQLDEASWRRMIYGTKIRQESVAVFGDFDCPDAGQTAPKRSRSTTPIQALGMLNSPFVHRQAKLFAQRVRAVGDPVEQVRLAFTIAIGRSPTSQELHRLRGLSSEYGLEQVCRVLWNVNEFLFMP